MPEQLPDILDQLRQLRKRLTPQRRRILEVVLASSEHLDVEQIRQRVSKRGRQVSYATIYRTMRMLADEGIVTERHFGNGAACFEYVAKGEHHDHLICTGCGRVTEFTNQSVLQIQQDVASQHDFTITGHKHEIYGLCRWCLDSGKGSGDR